MNRRARCSRRAVLHAGMAGAGALIASSLASCGAGGAPQVVEREVTVVVKETQVVKETVIVEQTVVATAPSRPATITLMLVDYNDVVREFYDGEVFPAFEEQNPGLTVAADYSSWGDLDVKVMTAFAGGLQPDLFQADNVEFGPKYNQRKIIAELNPLIEAIPEDQAKMDDFYPKALYEGCTIDGKIVGIPYTLDNRGLYYRKDQFAEVGLPETGPTNWTDFREAAIALTIREGATWKRAGWWEAVSGNWAYWPFAMFLWQNGGELLSADGTKPAFSGEEGQEALGLWVKLIREDKVGPDTDFSAPGGITTYQAGMLAMLTDGYYMLQRIRDTTPELMQYVGIVILEQKRKASLWYANCFLQSRSEREAEAWKLNSFLTLNDTNSTKYHEALGSLPPRKSIVKLATHITPLHLILIEDVMAAEGSRTTPPYPFALEMLARLSEQCINAVVGKATVQEALDAAAAETEAIIARTMAE